MIQTQAQAGPSRKDATHAASGPDAAVKVVPKGSGPGAAVLGVDIASGVGDTTFQVVLDALHEYSVIVLPAQRLTPAEQIAFARRFGEMRTSFYNRYGVPGHPELSVVSNIVDDQGQAIGIADAGMLWHTDASYLPTPDMYTLLYGIEIPQANGKPLGDTLFTSAWLAFEALPQAMRTRLRSLRAVHSFIDHLEKKQRAGNLKRAPLTAQQKDALPDVSHPVVRTHPVTGRPCLYVTEGHTSHIEGVGREESDQLLTMLSEHLKNPAFHYRHRWQAGDLLIWDNCSAHHLAIFDYGTTPRRLHRAGITGAVPV